MHPLLSTTKDVWQGLASILWFAIWFFSVCIFLHTFILRWWPGDRLLFVRLINYAMPWLIAIMIPVMVAASMTNRKWLMVIILLPTLYYVTAYAPYFSTKNQPLKNNTLKLKVMSYNVWSGNSDIASVATLIKKIKPDILLLQELRPDKARKLTTELEDTFQVDKNHFLYDGNFFLGTLSRYQLHQVPLLIKAPVLKSLAQTPAGAVSIYNAHFLRTVLRRSNQWERRHRQIVGLMTDDIAKTGGPIILGGDFNITDQTETYRVVHARLKDAHRQAGWGFGFTFPSNARSIKRIFALPPMIRIDYLFFNKHLQAISSETLCDSGGSDHMPIVAQFTIVPTKE